MTTGPSLYDIAGKRVWVAGHRGMVGQALVRRLQREACTILTVPRRELDLRLRPDVQRWMEKERPDAIIIAAATVGGIYANDTRSAEFLFDNLSIASSIIESAHQTGVEKLLFLGSSCIYPRLAPQPMSEDALLTGPLEPTNQWYAIAKISGVMLCRAYRRQYGCNYIAAMPTNLYGPADNYDLQQSHVIPALLAKAHAAKLSGKGNVVVWGTGAPRREFLYVDDLADALVFLLRHYSGEEHVNVGVGTDVTIREVAELIMRVVGLEGRLQFDTSKPDGMPRKLLDVSRLQAMGWKPSTGLEEGLRKAYAWYVENAAPTRVAS
jgi:GDP-L-fucose synthase